MAININSKLVTFAQQDLVLSHDDTERDKIAASMRQLEKVLKDKMSGNIKEFIHFGSFTRNTILPRKYDPNSDVDLMVVFNTLLGVMTPGTYRKKILDAVSTSYPNSISKKDFPAVKLELNHIMFDIVPAYTTEYFAWKSYYIPGSGDTWISTTPNDINQALTNKNQYVGNNIVRNVIRLCKHWNANAGYPLLSYSMEKSIVNIAYWGMNDTYKSFLQTINQIAWNNAGVRQALDYIKKYQGDYYIKPDEEKQFQWLQKLLPGLV